MKIDPAVTISDNYWRLLVNSGIALPIPRRDLEAKEWLIATLLICAETCLR